MWCQFKSTTTSLWGLQTHPIAIFLLANVVNISGHILLHKLVEAFMALKGQIRSFLRGNVYSSILLVSLLSTLEHVLPCVMNEVISYICPLCATGYLDLSVAIFLNLLFKNYIIWKSFYLPLVNCLWIV